MVVTESELENNEVFSKIKALKLEPDEFLIIGSGIMFALGIRSLDDIHDIDIIVNEKGWEKVKNLSKKTEYQEESFCIRYCFSRLLLF